MRKKKFALSVLLCLVFFTNPVVAANGREVVTSIGNVSCDKWNKDLQKSEEKGSDKLFEWVAFYVNRSWILGFATGLNYMADDDLLDKLDNDVVTDWTTKFCKENPERKVTDAIANLLIKTKNIVDQERTKKSINNRRKKD